MPFGMMVASDCRADGARPPPCRPQSSCAAMLRLLIVLTLLIAPGSLAAAMPAATEAPAADPCRLATAVQEQKATMPENLLTAISLVESGRWDEASRARIAWPWTVMAEGRGRYLPSKQAAIAEVRQLQARGVRNIDVGCMQINLHWHGDAFDSLEEAFDPRANAAYAADFLARLYDETRDWDVAAAYYHSRTPERAEYYSGKVRVALAELEGSPAVSAPAEASRVAAIHKQIQERRAELAHARETAEKALAAQRAVARQFAEDWRRQKMEDYQRRKAEEAVDQIANRMGRATATPATAGPTLPAALRGVAE